MIRYKTSLSIIILLSLNSIAGWAQQQSDERKITISASDSTIKTAIWDKPMKKKARANYTYYWYYAGTINHNQGGFSGKLIHGKYEVFNSQRKLLSQGNFLYGVKQGNWIRWNENGTKIESCSFTNGLLNGTFKTFDRSGYVLSKIIYKKGLPDGIAAYYSIDTTIIKKFRMGKEVLAKKHKRWFAKSKKTKPPHESEISTGEKYDKAPGKRKSFLWFKRTAPEKKNIEDKTVIPKQDS